MDSIDLTAPADRNCKSCERPIKFIDTSKGKKAPIDWPDNPLKVWQEDDPDIKWYDRDGRFHKGAKAGDIGFISHFGTCDDPNRFSKGKQRATQPPANTTRTP